MDLLVVHVIQPRRSDISPFIICDEQLDFKIHNGKEETCFQKASWR